MRREVFATDLAPENPKASAPEITLGLVWRRVASAQVWTARCSAAVSEDDGSTQAVYSPGSTTAF